MANQINSIENSNIDSNSFPNINVMKSDTYNLLLTLIAVMVILFSLGASIFTLYRCENQINELNDKYEILKEIVIRGE